MHYTTSILDASEVATTLVDWNLAVCKGERVFVLADRGDNPAFSDALWSAANAMSGAAIRLQVSRQEAQPLGYGLADHARACGRDWEDLKIRGSEKNSGGENVLFGGTNIIKSQFGGIVLDCSLSVNEQVLVKDGKYRL